MILFGLNSLEEQRKQQSHLWSHIFSSGMLDLVAHLFYGCHFCFVEAGMCVSTLREKVGWLER